eukprot:14096861-Heterocapsa_arctica.AAC.1
MMLTRSTLTVLLILQDPALLRAAIRLLLGEITSPTAAPDPGPEAGTASSHDQASAAGATPAL